MTIAITPNSGSFRGTTQIRLLGSDLDVAACQDDFADGVIGALWSNISSGSGAASERGSDGVVALDTGLTVGSVAGLRIVAVMLDADASASFRLIENTRPPAATNVIAELSLRTGTSRAGVQITTSKRGLEIIARVLAGGVVISNIAATIAGSIARGGEVALRLLRFGRVVRLYLAEAQIFEFEWAATTTNIEFLVRNDPTLTSRVRADVFRYARRPVVVLGSAPVEDLVLIGNNRALGTAPAASAAADTVSASVTGCSGAPVVSTNAFTYTREVDLLRFPTRDTALVLTNDLALTKGRPRVQ